MGRTSDFARWVDRVDGQIELITGHRPVYLGDGKHTVGYCPVCLDGTLCIRWLWAPEPGFALGRSGHCSNGCTERDVLEMIA